MRDVKTLLRSISGSAAFIGLVMAPCLLFTDAAFGHEASAHEASAHEEHEGNEEQGESGASIREELAELREKVEDLEEQRETDAEMRAALHEGKSWRSSIPELTIGGFANVDYEFTEEHGVDSDGSNNHFALGDLDLFLVSQLSERISFLSEILFEFDSEGDTRVDAERLLLRYEHADWLKISAGRGHTPIGYWNTAFHHGTWLWTTMRRPVIFEFEDEGGILPLHFVGLSTSGHVETSPGLFSYHTVAGNGRGKEADDVQVTDDVNNAKMVAGQFSFQPTSLPDLRFGVNGLYDEIPRDRSVLGREHSMDEAIVGAHLIHAGDPLELYIEGQWIHHDGGGEFDSYGGYAQVAYRIGKFKPYYRFDLLEVDDADPYFAQDEEFHDQIQHTLGLRFDWESFAALKLEYRRLNADDRADSDTIAAQFSVAF